MPHTSARPWVLQCERHQREPYRWDSCRSSLSRHHTGPWVLAGWGMASVQPHTLLGHSSRCWVQRSWWVHWSTRSERRCMLMTAWRCCCCCCCRCRCCCCLVRHCCWEQSSKKMGRWRTCLNHSSCCCCHCHGCRYHYRYRCSTHSCCHWHHSCCRWHHSWNCCYHSWSSRSWSCHSWNCHGCSIPTRRCCCYPRARRSQARRWHLRYHASCSLNHPDCHHRDLRCRQYKMRFETSIPYIYNQ